MTNAQSLAQGLPPLKPKRLYSQASPVGPIRPRTSNLPPVSGELSVRYGGLPLPQSFGATVNSDGSLTNLYDDGQRILCAQASSRGNDLEPDSGNYAEFILVDPSTPRSPDLQCNIWTRGPNSRGYGILGVTWTNPAGSSQSTATMLFYGYTDLTGPEFGSIYITGNLMAGQTAAEEDTQGLHTVGPIVLDLTEQ
ncbi:hypothetical protein FRB99_006663 [Tulasnella sp. 403]|nr:hypothetical protein FRB99_006663 [Tulasnella sp. 403]